MHSTVKGIHQLRQALLSGEALQMNYPIRNATALCERMILCVGVLSSGSILAAAAANPPDDYNSLVTLFQQWRTFERPPLKGDVPDYSSNTS